MRIVSLLGSPKAKGNTAGLLSAVETELGARGHETRRFHVSELDIAGCRGCGSCQAQPGSWSCRQKDGSREVFLAMREADAIIYATPIYCWNLAGQIKPIMDRHFCLVNGYGTQDHRSALAGRRALLLTTCAGPAEKSTDLVTDIFGRFCHYLMLENRGKVALSQASGGAEQVGSAASAAVEALVG